jgi:hypothetical protein
MNSKQIMVLIGAIIFFFVLIKVIADQLCASSTDNAVSAAASNVISDMGSIPDPSRPDPLSWEPVIRQVMLFFSKVCNR